MSLTHKIKMNMIKEKMIILPLSIKAIQNKVRNTKGNVISISIVLISNIGSLAIMIGVLVSIS